MPSIDCAGGAGAGLHETPIGDPPDDDDFGDEDDDDEEEEDDEAPLQAVRS